MLSLAKFAALLLLVFLLLSHLLGGLLPDVAALKTTNPNHTAFMGEGRSNMIQLWLPLSEISIYLQHAVIVSEDAAFYQHYGIDFHELKESFKRNLRDRSFSRGFSTITMQLARNLYLSPHKTISRKIKEVLIAIQMERELGKQRILELYLNVIEWGRGIYGAEAAAEYYFHKSAAALSPQEAAFLAGIIPSPTRLGTRPASPYVTTQVETILIRMKKRWGDD